MLWLWLYSKTVRLFQFGSPGGFWKRTLEDSRPCHSTFAEESRPSRGLLQTAFRKALYVWYYEFYEKRTEYMENKSYQPDFGPYESISENPSKTSPVMTWSHPNLHASSWRQWRVTFTEGKTEESNLLAGAIHICIPHYSNMFPYSGPSFLSASASCFWLACVHWENICKIHHTMKTNGIKLWRQQSNRKTANLNMKIPEYYHPQNSQDLVLKLFDLRKAQRKP